MDRRAFLASSAATLVAAGLPGRADAEAGDAQLNALFDAIFADTLAHSPELATSLGLDKGTNAAAKHRLSDQSAAESAREAGRTHAWLAKLEAIDARRLSEPAALNREIILYSLRSRVLPYDQFRIDSAQRPLSNLPAGRRLLFDSRFSQWRAHDRHDRGLRSLSRPSEPVRDGAGSGQRGAACTGGTRLPRARLQP